MPAQCQHKVVVLQVVLQWMQKGYHLGAYIIFSFIVFDKTQINLVELVYMLICAYANNLLGGGTGTSLL